MIAMENYIVFSKSVRGYSHLKNNTVCQDYSDHRKTDDAVMIAVADGHGSVNYFRSDIGSKLAVERALDSAEIFCRDIKKEQLSDNRSSDALMEQLSKSIINSWRSAVREHFDANPFKEEEIAPLADKYKNRYQNEKNIESAYGTTLILAVITDDYWFAVQIGDGNISVASLKGEDGEAEWRVPVEKDERCFLNATTSLCDSDAIDEFHYCLETADRGGAPDAVFLSTNGIEDSFPVNRNEEYVFKLYESIAKNLGDDNLLKEYLENFSRLGSGDDCSVAGIFKTDMFEEEILDEHS